MPAVLVAGHTATQNSPFLPSDGQNPRQYSLHRPTEGMARLSGLEYSRKHQYDRPIKVDHQSQY